MKTKPKKITKPSPSESPSKPMDLLARLMDAEPGITAEELQAALARINGRVVKGSERDDRIAELEVEVANLKRLMRRAIPTIDSRETDYAEEFKAACR